MKNHLLIVGVLLLLFGCKWELPTEKTLKSCQKPTGVNVYPDPSNPRTNTFSLVGVVTDVTGVNWKVVNASSQVVWQTTSTTGNPFTTFSADGTYTVTASVTTICQDVLSLTNTFTIKTSTAINFSLTDPMVHSGLSCVAVANDGTVIANERKDIQVWNPTTRTLIRTLKGHRGNVYFLKLSPDEKYLYSCGLGDDIYIWDWNTGTLVGTMAGNNGAFSKLQVTADGKFLASVGSNQKTINLWDTGTRQLVRTISHSDNIDSYSMIINSSNNLVAVRSYNGSTDYFIVWNYLTGAEVWRQSLTLFNSMAFSPDGQQLYVSYSGGLQIYNVNTKQLAKDVSMYTMNMQISSDGKYMSQGYIMYSLPNLTPIWTRTVYNAYGSMIFSNNSQLVVQEALGVFDVYQTASGTSIVGSPSPVKHFSPIASASFTKDMRNLAVIDNVGIIKTWNVTTGQNIITHIPQRYGGHANSVLNYTPDGKFLLNAVCNSYKLINATDGGEVQVRYLDDGICYRRNFIAPDGSYLVIGNGNNVLIQDISTGNTLKTLTGHTSYVRAMAISPDSKTVVSSGSDYTIRLWDAATGTQIGNAISSEFRLIDWLSFSPDGKHLTGTGSGIFLWDMASRSLIKTTPINYAVQTLAYSPDGKLLATGDDGGIQIWNMPDMTSYKSETVTYPVRKVQFTPDGKQLYVVTEKDFQVLTVN